MDPEMAALPLKTMELSGALTKQLRALGIERIGQLQEKSVASLTAAGIATAGLIEIARACVDLSIPWATETEIRASSTEDIEPVRPALPKWLLQHERTTWVLDGYTPRRSATKEKCTRCGTGMTLIATIDLTAYAGMPKKSIAALRCTSPDCDPNGFHGVVALVRVEKSGGDHPKGRRELSYPDLFDAARLGKSTDRSDAQLLDQQEVIGNAPRVGGWPFWGQKTKGTFPKCSSCGTELVLGLETSTDDDVEDALVCPAATCEADGVLVVTLRD